MKRQNKIFINIGLNNCPINSNHDLRIFSIIDRLNFVGLSVKASMLKNSTYKGEKEETLVIYSDSSYKLSKVIEIIENFCLSLNQECISLKYNLNDIIVYNPYLETEKIKFNDKYFKTIKA